MILWSCALLKNPSPHTTAAASGLQHWDRICSLYFIKTLQTILPSFGLKGTQLGQHRDVVLASTEHSKTGISSSSFTDSSENEKQSGVWLCRNVMGMIYLRITDNLQQRPSEHIEFGRLWENLLKANTAAHLHGFHVQPELSL